MSNFKNYNKFSGKKRRFSEDKEESINYHSQGVKISRKNYRENLLLYLDSGGDSKSLPSSLSPINPQLSKNNNDNNVIKEKIEKDILEQDFISFKNSVDIIDSKNKEKNNQSKIIQIYNQVHPWIKPNSKSLHCNGMLKLHYEIMEFYEFIKPTEAENNLRKKTYHEIKKIIQSHWENWSVEQFGSFPIGLNLPDSDIDIVIQHDTNQKDISKSLDKISDVLLKSNKFSYIEKIKARVPIIKATLKETNINIDISFGRKNGYEAKNTMLQILNEYPYMRPIIYVLKYFLKQKRLNETLSGGINSFVLYNLVFAYILYMKKTSISNSSNLLTLGHILLGFLQFYAFEFNYEDVGISVRYGGFFYKRETKEFGGQSAKGRNVLSIENYQDLSQDLGKSCFKFGKVVDCFKVARDALYYPSEYPVKSYIGSFIFLDDFIRNRSKKNNNAN